MSLKRILFATRSLAQLNLREIGSTLFTALTCFYLCACAPARNEAPRQIGPALDRSSVSAPNLTLRSLSGEQYSIAQYNGKVIIVDMWAPWCIPCRHELPAFQHLYDAFKGDGLVILGIGVEDSPAAIRGAAREAGVEFPVLVDTASASLKLFGASGVPTALIIDRRGKLVLFPDPMTGIATPWIVGPREWDSPEIAQQIRSLLAE